ncbi:MAG: NAD(P)-dependent oxidoreductase [Geopsychrobacter sp.]|nr:NAD(P)-dependent oxidoreductase [Geopsychrobacter sp.]
MGNENMSVGNVIIFGGTGFIGSHFCRHLIENKLVKKIYLADIKPLNTQQQNNPTLGKALAEGCVEYREMDVRNLTSFAGLDTNIDLIVNFAAVHREPGHQDHEYFETNLSGAENVCHWAEQVACNKIIFTSSISPYGVSAHEKDETTIPVPVTAYGSSKLVAEKIHQTWQKADSKRQLLIVRPGVVFGPGEGGNVTRLVRSVLKRYFFFMGNQGTRKSGGYVKELCASLVWGLRQLEHVEDRIVLYNFSMNPPPSMKEYVDTICSVAKVKRFIPSVPFSLLMLVSYPIEGVAKVFSIQQPISPVRIRKLVRPNNVLPNVLSQSSYEYKYDLNCAMEDWKSENPQDWE